MRVLISIITAFLVTAVAAQEGVKTKFTLVYLHHQESSSDFRKIKGLHFSHGKVDVPLEIKAFRQSILYPYHGGQQLSLYKLETNAEGETVRVPVVSTMVPAGAERGVLVLSEAQGKLQIRPFWFKRGELSQGARFVNLWKTKMLLTRDGGNKKLLNANGFLDIKPSFKGEQIPSYVKLDGYAPVPKTVTLKDGTKKKTVKTVKMLNRNLAIMKDRPLLVIAYQKNKFSSSMKALSLNGQMSVNQYQELYKLLPHLKPKVEKENQQNGPANEWEKGPAVTSQP